MAEDSDRADGAGPNVLPLPDFDELPINKLQHQIRSLEREELLMLLEHERAHGDRVPVIELLNVRLEQLAAGSQPSDGQQRAESARPSDARKGSPVSPDSAAPASGPLRHGQARGTPGRDQP